MVLKVKLNQSVVRKAIAKRNMSQNMLAIKVGTSSGYMSQIICGTRYPSPKMREKLQSVLSPLTFDDIFIIEENDNDCED
ncbi:MAG: helix-turn-helix transcriptional regulator [Dehalococcoidales bacterium]|nr:helix-turn-helix transcriptional regulator [Dehalococcoidales bacterium]